MVARCKPPSGRLAITFHRDGDLPIVIEAPDGEKALLRAVTMLLAHKSLQPGDRMTVQAAE